MSGPCAAVCHEPEAPTKKSELRSRFVILIVMCLGLFGSYYCYDIPAATESQLQRHFNSTDASTNAKFPLDFNLMYSVYSWPNTVLPFFGGYISDVLGVKLMGVVFISLITLGQFVVSIGISIKDAPTAWGVMWAGRTIFGFGGESLSVVQSAFVASYFQGKELAFAMGVNLALARIGSVVNDQASAAISSSYGVNYAYWVGFLVCIISLIGMVVAYYMDVHADSRIRKNKGLPRLANQGLLWQLFCRCCQRRGAAAMAIDDSGELIELPPAPPSEEIHLSAVLKFPVVFWILTLSCVCVYIDILTFNNNCASFVAQKYLAGQPLSQVPADKANALFAQANSIMAITYLVAGLLTPIFGAAIDWLGFRAVLVLGSAIAITGVHLILALTTITPTIPLVLLGLCYSIYASALWPSIAVVIEPKYQATAYGVVTAVQNFGLAVSPLVVSQFMPSQDCSPLASCIKSWNQTEIFFVGMGMLGIVSGIILNIADWRSKYHVLNLPDSKVQVLRAAEEAAAKAAESYGDATGSLNSPLLSSA